MSSRKNDHPAAFDTPAELGDALRQVGYISSAEISMASFLALRLAKPILAEGPAGTGKTELAKALARTLGRQLFRVQCYEGLDEAKLLYEWKYGKQLLYTQMLKGKIDDLTKGTTTLAEAIDVISGQQDAFFSERFLEPRPLLSAIRTEAPSVLLIDEVDRSGEEMEALLLEVLAEGQVTVAELGTIQGRSAPLVVLTSNDTRELSEALRRRCLHLFLDYPSIEREAEILAQTVPALGAAIAGKIAEVVAHVRTLDLKKVPSLSEAIDWARALVILGAEELGPGVAKASLSLLLKHHGDHAVAEPEITALLDKTA